MLETCQVWVLGSRHNVRRVRTKMSPRTKRSEDPGSIQRPFSSMGGCASLKRRMDPGSAAPGRSLVRDDRLFNSELARMTFGLSPRRKGRCVCPVPEISRLRFARFPTLPDAGCRGFVDRAGRTALKSAATDDRFATRERSGSRLSSAASTRYDEFSTFPQATRVWVTRIDNG